MKNNHKISEIFNKIKKCFLFFFILLAPILVNRRPLLRRMLHMLHRGRRIGSFLPCCSSLSLKHSSVSSCSLRFSKSNLWMCCKGFEKNNQVRSHRNRKCNFGSGSGFFLLVQVQTVQVQTCTMKSGLVACCRFQDLLRSVQNLSFVFVCKEEQPNKKGPKTQCALRAVTESFRENALKWRRESRRERAQLQNRSLHPGARIPQNQHAKQLQCVGTRKRASKMPRAFDCDELWECRWKWASKNWMPSLIVRSLKLSCRVWCWWLSW